MVDLVSVVGLLIGLNLATAFVLDAWLVPVTQAAAAVLAVWIAHLRGYSWADLALSPADASRGLKLGVAVSLVVVVAVALTAAIPLTRGFFEDDRFVDLTAGEIAYEAAVRIPFVTALTEELLFRSVLLAVLLAALAVRPAVVYSSIGFGLWHVLTTVGDLEGNATTDDLGGWWAGLSVVGVVAVTGTAGAAFAWLRLRSRSIVAPWLVHTAVNAGAFVAGVVVAR